MLASQRWTPKRRAQRWPTAWTTWPRKVRKVLNLEKLRRCFLMKIIYSPSSVKQFLHMLSSCPFLLLLFLVNVIIKPVPSSGMTTTNRHGNQPSPPHYSLSSSLALFCELHRWHCFEMRCCCCFYFYSTNTLPSACLRPQRKQITN